MTMHEPFKAHPKAARCHRHHHHRRCLLCLKRPVIVIARDTAAEEAIGPRVDGASAVKEVKGGAASESAHIQYVKKKCYLSPHCCVTRTVH
jgi:hypothetical protein